MRLTSGSEFSRAQQIRCNRLLSARRNIEAELFGGLLDPSDVIVHVPKTVFKATIMNSIEAILAREPCKLRMLGRIEMDNGVLNFRCVHADNISANRRL